METIQIKNNSSLPPLFPALIVSDKEKFTENQCWKFLQKKVPRSIIIK